jgi:hypothetical protein
LQSGGSDGGSQVGGVGQSQTIEQSAPTTQTANAQATSEQAVGSGSSSSTATHESLNQTAQSAQQAGPGKQHIEETAPSTQSGAATATRGTSTRGLGPGGWSLAYSFQAEAAQWSAADRPGAESPAPLSRESHKPTSPDRRVPVPDPQKMPNASLGGAPPTGGSHGAFVMLLLAFALTTPWWVRRRLPSALRRLMAVVSRLERPG